MVAFYIYIIVVFLYFLRPFFSKLINFNGDGEVLTSVLREILEACLKNKQLKRTISLIVNIVMKLSLVIILNTLVDLFVLHIAGISEKNKLAVIIVMSLISIGIDYVLLINWKCDLDKKEHAISKNFIDALMQLSVVITLIAGLMNLKLPQNNESALVTILYVFPALISYKYQLKVFDKDNENE